MTSVLLQNLLENQIGLSQNGYGWKGGCYVEEYCKGPGRGLNGIVVHEEIYEHNVIENVAASYATLCVMKLLVSNTAEQHLKSDCNKFDECIAEVKGSDFASLEHSEAAGAEGEFVSGEENHEREEDLCW